MSLQAVKNARALKLSYNAYLALCVLNEADNEISIAEVERRAETGRGTLAKTIEQLSEQKLVKKRVVIDRQSTNKVKVARLSLSATGRRVMNGKLPVKKQKEECAAN